jgi:hypothetical protein
MSQFLRFSNFVQKSAGENLSDFIISLNVTFSHHEMSDSVWILHYRDLFVSKNTELMNKMGKKLKKKHLK